jgi:hypothetical protein
LEARSTGRNCPIGSDAASAQTFPGGWKTPEQDWADLQDRMLNAMVRLEAALKAPVQALRV